VQIQVGRDFAVIAISIIVCCERFLAKMGKEE